MTPTFAPLNSLFHFPQGLQTLRALESSFGTATSGPLGAMVTSLFLISLMWVWLRNKFDTWSFWELFLRLFVAAAGLAAWDRVFFFVDHALSQVTTLFGAVDPNTAIVEILTAPFADISTIKVSLLGLMTAGPLFHLVGLLLFLLTWAMYNVDIAGAFFSTMLLYVLGPIFLACFVFEPLHDLWMRWVRFYLTVKAWMLVLNAFVWMVDAFANGTFTSRWSDFQSAMLIDCYLFFLFIGFAAAFPIARALVGGAATSIVSSGFLSGVAGATLGAGAALGGVAVGAAAGPGGAAVGRAVGTAAGGVTKHVLTPPKRE